ncbi:MAG: PH domain-containing protein [Nanoarchaeota archaeon]|nr:PH domain-containing protein [Nanoarchaeota archaeon]
MPSNEKTVLEINPSRWNYWHWYAAVVAGALVFPPTLLTIPLLEYYRKTTKYIVTDERLIKKRSFITKNVNALRHDAIINVHVGQSAIHRFMNIGTVKMGTQSANLDNLSFQGVYNPEKIGDKIQETLRKYHEKRSEKKDELNNHA